MLMIASVRDIFGQPATPDIRYYLPGGKDGSTPMPVAQEEYLKTLESIKTPLSNWDDPRWVVAKERFITKAGCCAVSTMFIGLTTSDRPHEVWSTEVFGGKHGGTAAKYCTREAALTGHRIVVKHIKECEGKPGWLKKLVCRLYMWYIHRTSK